MLSPLILHHLSLGSLQVPPVCTVPLKRIPRGGSEYLGMFKQGKRSRNMGLIMLLLLKTSSAFSFPRPSHTCLCCTHTDGLKLDAFFSYRMLSYITFWNIPSLLFTWHFNWTITCSESPTLIPQVRLVSSVTLHRVHFLQGIYVVGVMDCLIVWQLPSSPLDCWCHGDLFAFFAIMFPQSLAQCLS